jgi:hypothetical protein
VAEYRDLAADLARLQTAARGREREEVFYLSRLMAGAHNLLYRGRALTFKDVWRTFAVDAPREVRRSLGPIACGSAVRSAIIAYRGGPRSAIHARLRQACWTVRRMAFGGRARVAGTSRTELSGR